MVTSLYVFFIKIKRTILTFYRKSECTSRLLTCYPKVILIQRFHSFETMYENLAQKSVIVGCAKLISTEMGDNYYALEQVIYSICAF